MRFWRFVTLRCISAFVVFLLGQPAHAQTIQVSKGNRTIAITATGSASVMADTAAVHLGYQTYGPDSPAVYAKATKLSNAIIKALMAAGASKDAIESDTQSIAETQPHGSQHCVLANPGPRQHRRVIRNSSSRTNFRRAIRHVRSVVDVMRV